MLCFNKYQIAFEMLPFLLVAQRFALMESKMALADVLLAFQLSNAPGFEEVKFDKTPGIIRPEAGSMKVIMKPLE